jgi:hypothetical protein
MRTYGPNESVSGVFMKFNVEEVLWYKIITVSYEWGNMTQSQNQSEGNK